MQKWEYFAPQISFDSSGYLVQSGLPVRQKPFVSLEEWLNKQGEEGWEMIEKFIFKRPKQ